jgi:two-component system NtrC family sensor kinase
MTSNTGQTPLEQLERILDKHRGSDLAEIPVPQKLMEQVSKAIYEVIGHLNTAQGQLMQSEKMAMLGHLMAGIAHEINTPVASISSNVDLFARSLDKIKTILGSEGMPKEFRETRQIMQMVDVLGKLNQSNQTACDRIMQIARSLRNFARSETAEPRETDIHDELENALTLVHQELKGRIEVTRRYGDVPPCICFPNRLVSVFVNMLVNAAQAIEGEGKITIETLKSGDNIKIKFTDTGRGIPPENLDKLFDQGFTTKSPDEGTGLGLSICKQIMEEHRGKIEVESQVGEGAAFTITLPIDHATAAGDSEG